MDTIVFLSLGSKSRAIGNVQMMIVVGVIRKGLRGCLLNTGMILNNEFRSRVKLALHSDKEMDELGLWRQRSIA